MAEYFRIEFDGKIVDGEDPAAVREKLLKLYKGNGQAVAKIFSGKKVVVKDRLDRQTARKYQAAFRQAGALLEITPESPAPSPPEDDRANPPGRRAAAQPSAASGKPGPQANRQTGKAGVNTSLMVNGAAIFIVLAIFASLSLRFWASGRLDNFVGIDHVAANRDTVAIHAGGTIYLQSHAGKLERRIDLEELGITGKIADLEILDDGSLLIGDPEMKNIYRCDPRTADCVAFAPTGYVTLAENFKFMVDQPGGQLYIADTNNHRLLIQDLADSTCVSAPLGSELSYPNDMAKGSDNRIFLCDTNRCRVIPLEVGQDSAIRTGGSISSIPFLSSSPEDLRKLIDDPEQIKAEMEKLKDQFGRILDDAAHAKPYALALGPDNNLWVIQLNTVMTTGTINILSQSGEQIGKVELEKGAMPEDIISLADSLLVADSGRIRAYTIDPATHLTRDFGDQAFREQLADIHAQRSFLEGLKSWGLIGTIILAISASGVVLFAKARGIA